MKALAMLALLPLSAFAEPVPLFLTKTDGTLELRIADVRGLPGMPYACFGERASPARIMCVVIHPDGSASMHRVVPKEKSA